MNIILLSGGSGKNLWPLSNDIRSKQFIKLFRNDSGNMESMIQRIHRQISNVDRYVDIVVATSKQQASTVINQLGRNVGISVEPERKDTFPAIALALEYLKCINHASPDEPVIICPVDIFVEDSFFETFKEIADFVSNHSGITLLGTVPTEASTRYGYITPENDNAVSKVVSFTEKPNLITAQRLIQNGSLWNAGISAFHLGYVAEIAEKLLDYSDYYDLYNKYGEVTPIGFEKAVLEKEKEIHVIRSQNTIKDLGTWDALTSAMSDKVIGNGTIDRASEDVYIINDMDIPILAVDLKDVVISASQQGILVSSKVESTDIGPFVDHLGQTVMFADKSWGTMKVLDVENDSMTIKLSLKAGKRMSYHSHENRDEVWMIVSGTGKTIVDGMEQPVRSGDVITMEAGCRHTIMAETDLDVIEIQRGTDINVADKTKYDLE